MEHVKNIKKNHVVLNKFFSSKEKMRHLLDGDNNLIKSIHSVVFMLPYHIPHELFSEIFRHDLEHLENIADSKHHHEKKLNMIIAEAASGGSIFSRIGHAFRHLGHQISHVAHQAVHGITHAAEDVAHGAEKGYNAVKNTAEKGYNAVKNTAEAVFHEVNEGLDAAKDFITTYGPDIVKKALPYLEKAQNYALNAVAPGAGTALQTAENLYINKKINSALTKKGGRICY